MKQECETYLLQHIRVTPITYISISRFPELDMNRCNSITIFHEESSDNLFIITTDASHFCVQHLRWHISSGLLQSFKVTLKMWLFLFNLLLVTYFSKYLRIGAIHKLCRLKSGNFLPPPPLSPFLFSKVYVVNRFWGYPPYRDDIVYGRPLSYLAGL